MKIIRRVYTYLIALISLEIVIWGVINLMRTIFRSGFSFSGADTLSMSLALVLVGVPVFFGHWLWIKKNESDQEERSSYVRGFFYYLSFLIIFIPIIQNLLALIDRGLLILFRINPVAAFIGGSQSSIDNLIAIGVNGVIGYYLLGLFNQKGDSNNLNHFHEIFRLHDYVWVLYGLFFVLIGAQKILHFSLVGQSTALSPSSGESFVNGLALIIVGFPLWSGFWMRRQKLEALSTNMVRLVFLFVLSTIGITVSLTMASLFVHPFIKLALADPNISKNFVTKIAGPLSVGLPVIVMWFYYHRWLTLEINQKITPPENRGISRFYAALLALIGLIATLVGIGLFISIFASFVFGTKLLSETFRSNFSNALATLITALPLWLINWRLLDNPEPKWRLENSSSLTRRAYLYIAIFGTVIASMVSAIYWANTLLFGFLEERGATFGSMLLSRGLLTIEFIIFAIYHWQKIREDNNLIKEQEVTIAGNRKIILFGYSSQFSEEVIAAVHKQRPNVDIQAISDADFTSTDFTKEDTILVSTNLLRDKVVAAGTVATPNIYQQTPFAFSDLAQPIQYSVEQTVKAVLDLVQGKFKPGKENTKPWQIAAYIMAGLFLSEILLILISVMAESFR